MSPRTEHSPIELHQATNGEITADAPLLMLACLACSDQDEMDALMAGDLIDTDGTLVEYPCPAAQ